MKRKKMESRVRTVLLMLFVLLILAGLACVAEAVGGLKYGMPLLKRGEADPVRGHPAGTGHRRAVRAGIKKEAHSLPRIR